MQNNIEIGSLVLATAGRDEGYYFVVIGKPSQDYVLIVNGDNRTLSSPKKKKIKHLESMDIIFDNIAEKINQNKKIFDSEIYSVIKKHEKSVK